jgi:hypothetical protein
MARLLNRWDVWGAYTPLHRRGQKYIRDGKEVPVPTSYTAPRKEVRGKVLLTEDLLRRHYRGRCPEHVIGLHSTSPANTSLWGAVDIDWHGPESTAPAINLRAALAWYDWLRERGWHPLLTNSNGMGGYHLRVLLREPIGTPRLYAYMQRLVGDYRRHGMTAAPEIFPKQAQLGEGRRYGNWLRLPGRHHTREFWSEVWDGSRWLAGAEAVAHILSLTGDPPELVPPLPPQPPPPKRRPFALHATGGNLSARIAGYVRRCCPNLGDGQGRHLVAYRLAAWLLRDMAVSDDIALAWLERWDGGNSPPLGRAELEEIMDCARQYGQHAEGSGLEPASSRGVQVIRTRRPGHVIIRSRGEVRR